MCHVGTQILIEEARDQVSSVRGSLYGYDTLGRANSPSINALAAIRRSSSARMIAKDFGTLVNFAWLLLLSSNDARAEVADHR